jgi:hypothetical protein
MQTVPPERSERYRQVKTVVKQYVPTGSNANLKIANSSEVSMTCKVAAEINRSKRFQIQGLGMDIAALLRFRDRANSAIRFTVRSVTERAICELGRVAVPESEGGYGHCAAASTLVAGSQPEGARDNTLNRLFSVRGERQKDVAWCFSKPDVSGVDVEYSAHNHRARAIQRAAVSWNSVNG